MHCRHIKIDGPDIVAGQKGLQRKLPADLRVFFAASTEEALEQLGHRSVGQLISARGNLSIERDSPSEWMMKTDLSHSNSKLEVDAIRWAIPRLGTISIDAFALLYAGEDFWGFWIETSEGERRRVFASERVDGEFQALQAGFSFSTPWITRSIIEQY
ncbi:hypothetical protein [Shinella sp.]|uniref:hypothetical protein n=1 Tax=Shinella sp. TaxID=1870904 RepID=UPI0028B1D978|nr:hypothetical protein [Shinella sp.]